MGTPLLGISKILTIFVFFERGVNEQHSSKPKIEEECYIEGGGKYYKLHSYEGIFTNVRHFLEKGHFFIDMKGEFFAAKFELKV